MGVKCPLQNNDYVVLIHIYYVIRMDVMNVKWPLQNSDHLVLIHSYYAICVVPKRRYM